MDTIRVLIVDDHTVVRTGIRLLLQREPDIEVVGEAGSGEEAVRLARSLKPDVVVMDVVMPGMNGLEATRRLRQMLPELKVVALTMHDDEFYVREMIQAGVAGYVIKGAMPANLLDAVRTTHRGQAYLYPSVATRLFADLRSEKAGDKDFRRRLLTDREKQVLRLITTGYATKEVASFLNISVHTVGRHVSNIMNKLGLHSRTELVRYALKTGLTDDMLMPSDPNSHEFAS